MSAPGEDIMTGLRAETFSAPIPIATNNPTTSPNQRGWRRREKFSFTDRAGKLNPFLPELLLANGSREVIEKIIDLIETT
jgi:hypothetical protein